MGGGATIGVTGLAVMGGNLARHGHAVAVHNRTEGRTHDLVENFGHEGTFIPAYTAKDFVAALERPRRILIMVKAGAPTDAVIDEFATLLEPGDVIVDAGNAHFADTRREAALRAQGLHFVGTGVSGGEEGTLHGPSIMPGTTTSALDVDYAQNVQLSGPRPRTPPTRAVDGVRGDAVRTRRGSTDVTAARRQRPDAFTTNLNSAYVHTGRWGADGEQRGRRSRTQPL